MIQIMGAGALGSLIGALIQLSGKEVVFVARGKQFEALKQKLTVLGLINAEIKVKVIEKPVDAEFTFFTVKAYDTEPAGRALSKVDPGIVCTLQNGIGVERVLKEYLKNVVRGVTSYGANLLDYGKVVYAGEGFVYLPEEERAKKIAKILREANIRVELVKDIDFFVWSKAIVNSVINPLSAICRVRNGFVIENEKIWWLAERIAKEGQRLMEKLGYKFDAISEVKRVAKLTANNKSSMLQDVMRGKRTEIDYINGEIIKKCKELGINCEINEIVWKIMKGIEDGIAVRDLDLGHANI
ncbi:MAG: 2-dehydropantoate 2-reductase [Archaeoglobaceae archaeon]|nr:2-dehydropantoate 2-reductase [Archaeoglobaceae archaeon]MDW7989579.1 2-dehydropantoate 2-reductase [Archaeoglobaceae archaeon]